MSMGVNGGYTTRRAGGRGKRGAEAAFIAGHALPALRSRFSESAVTLFGDHAKQTPLALSQAIRASATAFICTNVRANMASEVPVVAYEVTGNTTRPAAPNTAPALFAQVAAKHLWRATAYYLIYGAVYWRKHRNAAKKPTRLELLNPLDVRPDIDPTTRRPRAYQVTVGTAREEVAPADMVAVVAFNPESETDGLSALEVALLHANISVNVARYGAAFFANSARPDGLLTYEGELDEETQQGARTYWQRLFQGAANAFRTAILGGGGGRWRWEPITANPVDLAMTELSGQADLKICSAFQVNPVLAGVGQAGDPLSASNTVREIRQTHIEYVAVPDARRLIEALNVQWLEPDFAGLYTLDLDISQMAGESAAGAGRSAVATQNYTAGIWGLNEARAYTGKAPLKAVIDVDPTRALAVWNAGVVMLDEVRMAIGYPPLPEGKGAVFNVPAIGVQLTADQIGLIQGKPSYPSAFNPSVSLEQAAAVAAGEPPPPDPVIMQPATPTPSTTTKSARAELKAWAAKVAKHGPTVRFVTETIPPALAEKVRAGLGAGQDPAEVFKTARAELVGEAPLPSQTEAYDFWRDYDAVQAEIGALWLSDYMALIWDKISGKLNTFTPADLDQILAGLQPDLVAAWVGSEEAPGPLMKLALAGMAAGDAALEMGVTGNPAKPVALSNTRVDWALLAREALAFVQAYAFDLITRINQTTRDLVRATVEAWLQGGGNLEELRQQLAPIFQDGRRAFQIAQTESTRLYFEGSSERYKAAGVQRVVWQTVNVGRGRLIKRPGDVCRVCSPLHNKRGELIPGGVRFEDGATYTVPAHVGCRCWVKPARGEGG